MERSSILLHFVPQRQLKTTYRFRVFFRINFVKGISCTSESFHSFDSETISTILTSIVIVRHVSRRKKQRQFIYNLLEMMNLFN